jgi:hypothetical protein
MLPVRANISRHSASVVKTDASGLDRTSWKLLNIVSESKSSGRGREGRAQGRFSKTDEDIGIVFSALTAVTSSICYGIGYTSRELNRCVNVVV